MPLPEDYARLTFLDRIASLVLATIYSHDHVEVAIGLDCAPPTRNKEQKAALAALQQRVDEARGGYAGHNVVFSRHYMGGEGAQMGDVSDIGYDTAAVAVVDRKLYIALNYKVRTTPNVALRVRQQYASFGDVSVEAWAQIKANLDHELAVSGDEACAIDEAILLSVPSASASAAANAAPHAEMQLVSFLEGLGHSVDGMAIGVSKACCSSCAEQLRLRNVQFTDRPGNAAPGNWTVPGDITATVTCRMSGSWAGG